MEENQNSGVDFSDYLNSPKKRGQTGISSTDDQKKKRNKVYVAIIIVCFLAMAAIWAYYLSQG